MQRRQNGERLGPAHYGPEPRRIPIEFEFEPLDIGCRAAASEARDAIAADRTYEPGARSGRTTPSSATERHAPAAGATIYENLAFHASLQQELSKSLILSRFFRSTERNFAAYENLCTGCGYGVFEAHGRLCHFCQLVVHGAYERRAAQGEDSANIYENVCDKCAAFYSSDECACCPPPEERPAPQAHPSAPTAAEQAGRATPPDKAKRDKKGLFHGLIGSLRRAKSSATPPRSPRQGKRPEIVHNVEGYESVFRTQDTFDLDRICELKRSQTSRSEQHIYGRLKHPPHSPHGLSASESSSTLPASLSPALSLSLSQSHDHLTLAPSPPVANGRGEQQVSATPTAAASAKVGSKRPRISRPRLLRSLSRSSPGKTAPESAAAPLPAKQSLYLAEHVCQWLTSLRRETHSYWSFGLADDGALCDPKSIPARHTLIGPGTGVPTLAPTEGVTNGESNGRGLGDVSGDSLSSGSNDLDLGAVVTLRRPRRVGGEARAKDEVENENEDEARLVRDFKRSLAAKAMNRQRQRQRQQQRAALEPPATTATSTAQQRAKRQAIYLKIDESPSDVSSHRRQHISRDSDGDGDGESERYNNYEQHQHQGRNQNKHQPLDGPASDQVGERGLASHRVALQPITASIYELEPEYELVPVPERDRDSEFVNDILSAFESFLRRESTADTVDDADAAPPEVGTTSREPSSAAAPDCSAPATATAIDRETADRVIGLSVRRLAPAIQERPTSLGRSLDVGRLFEDLLLSRGLNRVVVHYDASLSVFLHAVREREPCRRTYWQRPAEHWVRTFHRFVKLCLRTTQPPSDSARGIRGIAEPVGESDQSVLASGVESAVAGTVTDAATTPECETDGEAGDNGRPGNGVPAESPVERDHDSSAESQNPDESAREEAGSSSEAGSEEKPSTSAGDSPRQPKPQVPQRDPRTCISRPSADETSPPLPARRGSPPAAHATSTASAAMTVPTAIHQGRGSLPNNSQNDHNGTANSNNNNVEEEEDIYQPIWKFQTVGKVQERYHTDADYYELDDAASKALRVHDPAAAPTISIATDVEDHGEWETDDEFMFATQLLEGGVDVASTADGDGDGEGRPPEDDGCSLNSSTVRSRSSRSGSSFTGSTVTGYASSTMTMASAASTSLVHPLLRSIGVFYSPTEPKLRAVIYDYDRVQSSTYFAKRPATDSGVGAGVAKVQAGRSPVPPPRTTSAAKTKAASFPGGGGVGESQLQLLPDSVQAWKFLLLDVNYLEDEEDMIVAETEILRAQEPKEDPETRQTQQLNFLQRFKSASIGNLIDIPTEEDKKSIAERMRSKLQRGVLKLNVRSPKSEKKSRGKFRRAEATSLYLEDGMKPKYPIFGAALDQLELNQTTQPNVPRFVVDCVEYIERKECVQQDGLYRASGNKVSIDELKQKLSESYIYDPKLLVTDDIHTLTSLLKQFFRELGAPLIPQETYERLGRNLTEAAAIERLRSAFAEMREPNRSTLKFLIRHLTNVASFSAENRMPASNLAIVWGPCILSANQIEYDIARMNTLAKVLIENYDRIFGDNERLVA